MPVRGLAAALLPLAFAGLSGAQPGTYAGARACAPCHQVQFKQQASTGHARSLHAVEDHPLAASFATEANLTRPPGYRFRIWRGAEGFQARAADSENVMDIPIEWAFGAGEQAVTFVTRVNEEFYLEHSFSYYPALRGFGPTPGQQDIKPKSIAEAMGLLYKTADPDAGILGCFECHSTGPVRAGEGRRLTPSEAGVRCEACHGAGASHADAAARGGGDVRRLIGNPARLSATELNEFCGRCHRPPAAEPDRIDWDYAWNVRHQPVYLSRSKCFSESGGALSCLSCHGPHGPLRRGDPAYYNSRCGGCHTPAQHPPKPVCRQEGSNCVNCHMPRVSPQPPLVFANHWIGVYGDGAKLKPVR